MCVCVADMWQWQIYGSKNGMRPPGATGTTRVRPCGDHPDGSALTVKPRIKDGELSDITLWLFNIAMENGPFIDDFSIKTTMYRGFSMVMLNNQRVVENDIIVFLCKLDCALKYHLQIYV